MESDKLLLIYAIIFGVVGVGILIALLLSGFEMDKDDENTPIAIFFKRLFWFMNG